MKTFRFFCLSAVAMAMAIPFAACSDDDDKPSAGVPQSFVEALKAIEPDAENVKWETEGPWRVAEFDKAGVECEVWFDAMSAWAMTEKDFGRDWFLVPDNAVNNAFATGEYGTWTVDDIKYYLRSSDEFYVVEVEKTGQPDMDLFFSKTGEMFKAAESSAVPDMRPDTVVNR